MIVVVVVAGLVRSQLQTPLLTCSCSCSCSCRVHTQVGDVLISNARAEAMAAALTKSPVAAECAMITFVAAEGAEEHVASGCRQLFWERTLDHLLPLLQKRAQAGL